MVFFIILIFVLFYMLGSTADKYFVPALTRMASKLGLSPDVAGVSLLALGNGAPDVFSAFASVSSDDMDISIGGLVGAGIFVTCLVFGIVGTISDDAEVDKRSFLRDTIFYSLMLSAYIISCSDERITLWEPLSMLSVYLIFVVYVARNSVRRSRAKAAEATASLLPEQFLPGLRTPITEANNPISPVMRNPITNPNFVHETTGVNDPSVSSELDDAISEIDDDDDEDWASLSLFKKSLIVAAYPFDFIRDYSIPPGGRTDYNRIRCIIAPFFSLLVIWLAITGTSVISTMIGDDLPAIVLIVLVGLIISFVLLMVLPRDGSLPPKRIINFFLALSFGVSIVWIFLSAVELVSILQTVGLIWGVSSSILGVTVLAWGNSLGDFVSNISVARQG